MSLPIHHEVKALVRVRPVCAWFAHSFVPSPCCGLDARFYQAEPAPVVVTTKCPESLCLMLVLPSSGRRVRLLRGHYSPFIAPTDSFANPVWLSPTSVCSLVRGVCAGCYQALLPPGSSRRYFCESFLGCLVPCHGGPTKCTYLFLPPCHRPSPTEVWVGFPA